VYRVRIDLLPRMWNHFFRPQLCSQRWLITALTPFHRVSRLYEFFSHCLRVLHVLITFSLYDFSFNHVFSCSFNFFNGYLFVLLTFLLTFFVFWVEFQCYWWGGGGGDCCCCCSGVNVYGCCCCCSGVSVYGCCCLSVDFCWRVWFLSGVLNRQARHTSYYLSYEYYSCCR
jgi:hypothetical protein